VHAGRFDVSVIHTLSLQPFPEIAVECDQVIVGAASNPKEMQLVIGFGIECRKILLEIFGNAAGAERTDPGKFVEVIQAGE
jgi:hypothetical protein